LAVLACAVLADEVRGIIERHGLPCRVELLAQGLHNEPDHLRNELQAAIDRCEAAGDGDGIALVYGLCSRGTEGLISRRLPIAIPRAHDCITLLLGDRRRYAAEVAAHPGSYWYSPGWIRHTQMPSAERRERCREHYRAVYGEEQADYLMEQLEGWIRDYDRAVFVDQGDGAVAAAAAFTRRCAAELGWRCDRIAGDPGLLHRLLAGDWRDEEIAVLRPGQTICMNADADRIVDVVAAAVPPCA
jgi:hypothetical protein